MGRTRWKVRPASVSISRSQRSRWIIRITEYCLINNHQNLAVYRLPDVPTETFGSDNNPALVYSNRTFDWLVQPKSRFQTSSLEMRTGAIAPIRSIPMASQRLPGLIIMFRRKRRPSRFLSLLAYAEDTVPGLGMLWPVEWITTYGNGRVYVSVYGHVWPGDVQPAGMRCAAVQTIIPRVWPSFD